jgi:hypothetical protein
MLTDHHPNVVIAILCWVPHILSVRDSTPCVYSMLWNVMFQQALD